MTFFTSALLSVISQLILRKSESFSEEDPRGGLGCRLQPGHQGQDFQDQERAVRRRLPI